MRTLIILLLLTATSYGQITLVHKTVIEVDKTAHVVDGFVEVPKDFVATPFNVVYATWKTEVAPEDLRVSLTDEKRRSVPSIKVGDNGLVVMQQGHFWLRVEGDTIDFEAKKRISFDEEVDFFIEPLVPPSPPGPLPPEPLPPGPTPVVPTDGFDNIGQRVAVWTKGLPSNKQISSIYAKHSLSLRSDPSTTVDSVSAVLRAELLAVPGYSQYGVFAKNVTEDAAKRWPMSRGVLADYWSALALGLGAN